MTPAKRNIYGTPCLTLSEVIDDLMIMQSNDRRNHYFSYLKHANRAWKELLWNSIWAIRQQWLCVDPLTRTVRLPNDVTRAISLSVVDIDGNLRPISYNPNFNTLTLEGTPKKCSCRRCDGATDTLCSLLDLIQFRTEDVVIDGVTYAKKIYNRMDESGNLQEVQEVPTFETSSSSVVYITMRKNVCALEVTETGCVAATLPNRLLIREHCGCHIMDCHLWMCDDLRTAPDVAPYLSYYGDWKWDTNAGDVIHLRDVRADKVIFTYQTSGECDNAEMLVPDYAVNAVHFMMMWRMVAFNPSSTRSDKDAARRDMTRARTELRRFLHPIRVSQFMRLSSTIPLW